MQLWQFFVRKYSRTSPLKCAHILRRQYTVVQPGCQPSNRGQNFRLPADVKRANWVEQYKQDFDISSEGNLLNVEVLLVLLR